jgi:hypothetical protein
LQNRGGLGQQGEGGDGFVVRLDFVFDDRSQVAGRGLKARVWVSPPVGTIRISSRVV